MKKNKETSASKEEYSCMADAILRNKDLNAAVSNMIDIMYNYKSDIKLTDFLTKEK